ncbi:putative cytidine deaminase [Rosellinia necatrix]|uniref:Putative cytidine deaminase n=1 Tax=Rosellinia necatrix TaxID=77044 RepID=A0A1W2TJ07_ROSNE|nr:putative cytidine deaminase [Rosellinia necatrix]
MPTSSETLTPADLAHLRRAIALAAEALEAGDAPFGSVLVSGGKTEGEEGEGEGEGKGEGRPLHEDRNRIHTTGDGTRHPELALARWAAAHVPSARARAAATVYTSGEHCAMCAAAHAWAGLGRVVYAASTAQLRAWMAEFRAEKGGEEEVVVVVAPLPIDAVAPGLEVVGPVPLLEADVKALHRRYAGLPPA